MSISVNAFWLQKVGNAPEEYEDAFCVELQSENLYRFAVADGATEASFSDIWAQQLVTAYSTGQLDETNIQANLPTLQQAWLATVKQKPLAWYAEEKLQKGAFASLLGLTIYPDNRYVAVAVGDSCLFQIRNDELLVTFPMTQAADFNNNPTLLSSIDRHTDNFSHLVNLEHTWQTNDIFILMTDALACWLLANHEQGIHAWQSLIEITQQDDFTSFITRLLIEKQLKNDDMTLLVIKIT